MTDDEAYRYLTYSDLELWLKIKQRYRTAEQCHKVFLRLCPPPPKPPARDDMLFASLLAKSMNLYVITPRLIRVEGV